MTSQEMHKAIAAAQIAAKDAPASMKEELQELFKQMTHWAPELRHGTILAFCKKHDLAVNYRWEQYEGGWLRVRIEHCLVSPDDPTLNIGTGEIQQLWRWEWRRMRRDQGLPGATARTLQGAR